MTRYEAVGVRLGYRLSQNMKEPLIYKGSWSGRNRTRTCDPIDVNDVLSALGRIVPESDVHTKARKTS